MKKVYFIMGYLHPMEGPVELLDTGFTSETDAFELLMSLCEEGTFVAFNYFLYAGSAVIGRQCVPIENLNDALKAAFLCGMDSYLAGLRMGVKNWFIKAVPLLD